MVYMGHLWDMPSCTKSLFNPAPYPSPAVVRGDWTQDTKNDTKASSWLVYNTKAQESMENVLLRAIKWYVIKNPN